MAQHGWNRLPSFCRRTTPWSLGRDLGPLIHGQCRCRIIQCPSVVHLGSISGSSPGSSFCSTNSLLRRLHACSMLGGRVSCPGVKQVPGRNHRGPPGTRSRSPDPVPSQHPSIPPWPQVCKHDGRAQAKLNPYGGQGQWSRPCREPPPWTLDWLCVIPWPPWPPFPLTACSRTPRKSFRRMRGYWQYCIGRASLP